MKEKLKKIFLCLGIFGLVFLVFSSVSAHRSGCHRWHSCPSDSGSYTCGDLGYPCQYPTYPASGGVIYPPSGYYKNCYDCPLKKVPDNIYTLLLRYQSYGDEIKKLQEVLIDNGFMRQGLNTGWFGPLTKRAVVNFQKIKGLVTDGIVGPKTRAELDKL